MTVNVADLAIDMSVSDTYRPPNPLSHRANTLEEVHLPPIPASLANVFLFSTRDDREAFRRSASEHISLLSRCLSTILAQAHTYMSQVETYRICVSTTLRLRLFCTHGTPVLKTLDCWPTLPIVVQYGGPRSSLSAGYRG
jgi:hypothetical protein